VAATEDAAIRQRHPIATAFDFQIKESHVQVARWIRTERRAALEFVMDYKDIVGVQGRKHFHSSS
jgi:hypothetical protein